MRAVVLELKRDGPQNHERLWTHLQEHIEILSFSIEMLAYLIKLVCFCEFRELESLIDTAFMWMSSPSGVHVQGSSEEHTAFHLLL